MDENVYVFTNDSVIESINFPLKFNVPHSLHNWLLFLAQWSKDPHRKIRTIGSFTIIRGQYDEDALPQVELAWNRNPAWLSEHAPTKSAMFDNPIPVTLTKGKGVDIFTAHVVIIRNDPGKKQGSLPKLFKRAAQYVQDNGLDFDTVESVRFVSAWDEKFREYPELHVTIIQGRQSALENSHLTVIGTSSGDNHEDH